MGNPRAHLNARVDKTLPWRKFSNQVLLRCLTPASVVFRGVLKQLLRALTSILLNIIGMLISICSRCFALFA